MLQDKVRAHPAMTVFTGTTVTAFESNSSGKLENVELEVRAKGEQPSQRAAAAVVFIGLDPNTAFLGETVDLDELGFVISDEQFRSSLPGVFVAGDVRRGSTKQLASAVGEGAAAAIQIRYHLDKV